MSAVLYRHYASDGTLLYVGASLRVLDRLQEHKSRSSWYDLVLNIRLERHPSIDAAKEAERIAIRDEHPVHNKKSGMKPSNLVRKRDKTIVARNVHVTNLIETMGSISKVADSIGVRPQAVARWIRIPALRCHAVSRLTGLPLFRLRPDLWDAPDAAPRNRKNGA